MIQWAMFCNHCRRRWTAYTAKGDQPRKWCLYCGGHDIERDGKPYGKAA